MSFEKNKEQVREVQLMLIEYNLRYAVINAADSYCDADELCTYKEALNKFIKSEGSKKMVKVSGYDPMYISGEFRGLKNGVYVIIQEVLMYRG